MRYEQTVFDGIKLEKDCKYNPQRCLFLLTGSTEDGTARSVIPITEQLMSRHILLLGGIGSGKTNAFNFLVRNIRSSIDKDDVVVIFDSKGDYYKNFYQPGDIVISNDKNAIGLNGTPDYWNIFNEILIDDRAEENIIEISKTLFFDKIRNSSQPFFPNAAKDLFAALMLELIRNEKCESMRNNRSLRNLFDSFSVPEMKKILSKHKDLKAMISYIENPESGQSLGVVSELQQLVREIFIGNFAKRGNLSIRDIIKNKGGKVVFIEYDLSIGTMLTTIYKLIIDLAIKQALCRTENEGNVYFIMDEFRLLPNLQHIDNGVNFGRSLGAKFIVGVQNVDQISAAYGSDMASSILSGFATNISFRVNDKNSRDYIKGLYGQNIKLQTYASAVQSRGITEQIREGNVVEDADITSLKIGSAIVGIMNYPPFTFHFDEYKMM